MAESSGGIYREGKLYSSEKRVLGVHGKCGGEMIVSSWPYLFRCIGDKTAGARLCFLLEWGALACTAFE